MTRRGLSFNEMFLTNGGHPPLLKLFIRGEIELETIIILDMVLKFVVRWDEQLADPCGPTLVSRLGSTSLYVYSCKRVQDPNAWYFHMNPDWSILEEEMQQVEYLQQTVIDCVRESNLNEDPDPQLILDYYHHLYALMSKQGDVQRTPRGLCSRWYVIVCLLLMKDHETGWRCG